MTFPKLFRAVSGVRQQRVILSAVVFFICVAIVYFASGVQRDLRDLSTANSDSVQWNLSQAEVDHLAFLTALTDAARSEVPDLEDVRLRFDILYSRINILETGDLYAVLRESGEVSERLVRTREFLDFTVPFIDGSDARLAENLDTIAAQARLVRQDIRKIALTAVGHFSALHDTRRAAVSQTLIGIAALTAILLIILLVLVVALLKLNRINQLRAVQNETTSSRMSTIVATSLDAIVVTDRNGIVLDYNGAAEDIFGYSRDEAIGSQMADLIIPDHLRAAHAAGMKRHQADGSMHVVNKGRVRLEGKRKSGAVFPVEFSVASDLGDNGEIFVSYLRDISREVAAENELREARDSAIAGEKSKAQLLAIMSHEIRTPLNGLLGSMDLLLNTELTAAQRNYLSIMQTSGNFLLRHVNDVLDISRHDAGKLAIDHAYFDLNTLIGEVVESQKISAENAGNGLDFCPHNAAPSLVRGDPLRLKQVLLNLIGNAIKFTRDGHISVETDLVGSDGMVEIRVTDTGVGIADDDLTRIFEDFTTVDSSYRRQTSGTGLGLAIARRMTTAMGGEIGAESELGEGSMFWLRLPIGLSGEAGGPQAPDTPKTAEDETWQPAVPAVPLDILLVEDNSINRLVVHDLLVSDNHRVVAAKNGKEGIALAERRKFDLVLMDISMPEIDGTEAATAIRNGNGPSRDTPIIALTAHAMAEDIQRFRNAGMNDVVVKPASRKSLRAVIAAAASCGRMARDAGSTAARSDILVDLEVLAEFREDVGNAKFSRILAAFLSETDGMFDQFKNGGAEAAPAEKMTTHFHKLSGSAAMFGAKALRDALIAFGKNSGPEDPALCDRRIAEITKIWEKTRRELAGLD